MQRVKTVAAKQHVRAGWSCPGAPRAPDTQAAASFSRRPTLHTSPKPASHNAAAPACTPVEREDERHCVLRHRFGRVGGHTHHPDAVLRAGVEVNAVCAAGGTVKNMATVRIGCRCSGVVGDELVCCYTARKHHPSVQAAHDFFAAPRHRVPTSCTACGRALTKAGATQGNQLHTRLG